MLRNLLSIAIFTVASVAHAQHSDIEVTAVNGKLVVAPSTEGYVFEGQLGETIPNFAGEPGFEAEDGALRAGDELGFNVRGGLLFWDGASFVDPLHAEFLTISKASFSTLVAPDSGAQPGFHFATADSEGGLHEDLEFLLARPDGNSATAVGAYGLRLELTSPAYERSNGFLILLNHGLAEEQFEAGVAAAGKLVPEPSSLTLLAMSLLCLAARSQRRQSKTSEP